MWLIFFEKPETEPKNARNSNENGGLRCSTLGWYKSDTTGAKKLEHLERVEHVEHFEHLEQYLFSAGMQHLPNFVKRFLGDMTVRMAAQRLFVAFGKLFVITNV